LRSDTRRLEPGTEAAKPAARALPTARRHLPDVQRAWTVLTVAGLLAGGAMALGACGGDDDDAGRPGVDQARTAGSAADGEPEATDAATVQPYVERLLIDYDGVVNQIVGDPDVAADPDHPLIQQYLDLYEPDSAFARQLVDAWAERGAEGLATRPFDDAHPASLTRLDGDIEVVSGDEVSFPACIERRLVVVDGEGRTVQRTRYREQRGEGIAVRLDGEWRLRELAVVEGTARCTTGDHGGADSGIQTDGPGGPGGAEGTTGAGDGVGTGDTGETGGTGGTGETGDSGGTEGTEGA
jgi:hypothetical protein